MGNLGILGSKSHTQEVHKAALDWGSGNVHFLGAKSHFDVYNPLNVDKLVDFFQEKNIPIALMQSDDGLLPTYFLLNRALGHKELFPIEALECSLNKVVMRKALESGGLTQTPMTEVNHVEELESIKLDKPVIFKASLGQGGKGYYICTSKPDLLKGYKSIKTHFPNSNVLVEEYFEGRQFNVDGLINRGEVFIYGIQEENYEGFLPNIQRSWFLFNPQLSSIFRTRIIETVKKALKACQIQHGAFHCELRINDKNCLVIDISNRMGEDFCFFNKATTGRDQALDYVRLMHDCEPKFHKKEINTKILLLSLYFKDPQFNKHKDYLLNKAGPDFQLNPHAEFQDRTDVYLHSDHEEPLRNIINKIY